MCVQEYLKALRNGDTKDDTLNWGDSDVMNNLRSIVEKVAATDANILITGENGTGKEVLANELPPPTSI